MGYVMGFLRSLVGSFGSEGTGAAGRPGRQLRLAVVDAAKVDGRRHLILIRRDNVEHLLLIGGPTDIVVEPNVVRAAAREPALPQATQHPATQLEAAPALSTPPRPPMAEEPVPQHAEAEPPVPLAPRQPRPVDRLVSDRPARERQLSSAAAEMVFTPAAEHNSAEAAQRLVEAVLLRSRRKP